MTNKEDDDQPSCVPHMANLLAVHLVSQVLEEAYIIASTAKETGKPWCYITNLKKKKSSHADDAFEENLTYTVSNGDYINDSTSDDVTSAVVTSTPQKTEIGKPKNEAILIGQGDEDLEKDSELLKSTSMFINNLFDMSDVEGLMSCDDTEITESNDAVCSIFDTITKIVDAYVNLAFECASGLESQKEMSQELYGDYESSINNSSYSFLSDAVMLDIHDTAKFIKDNVSDGEHEIETIPGNNVLNNVIDENGNKVYSEQHPRAIASGNTNDTSLYENTYLTLNRDYEQYSDEEPVLQDPKGLSLQEIDLLNAQISEEKLTGAVDTFKINKEIPTTSRVSTSVTGSRKSRLVRRCRVQGERILACLRGWWWRRKVDSKRKMSRVHGSVRGLCPLSPDARRRATSLLDQRHLRSPSPPQHVIWKFNTINESLVRSSRWKHFGFKTTYTLNED